MKHTNNKKENTLFSYFTKLKDPAAEKSSLSSIITRKNTVKKSTPIKKDLDAPIDLTNADEEDIIMIPSSPTPDNSQTIMDSQTSVSSFSSRERVHNEVIMNTSKYNNKAWSAQAKERGPQVSSQDASSLDKQKTVQKFERIVIKKTRTASKPTFGWLGANDVKPYSSNYTPYSMSDTIKKPSITLVHQSSAQQPNISSKRGWDDDFSAMDNSTANKNAAKFWSDQFSSKKSKTENNYSNKKMESLTYSSQKSTSYNQKSNTYNQQSNTLDKEYQPELSGEQERVLNMVLNEKKSLFFTGSAGTGKSVLLRAIIDKLGERYGSQLAVTASTGIAACNINGCTLHRLVDI